MTLLSRLRPYFTAVMLGLVALGFASGLPLALTLGTLSRWLAEYGIEKSTIGLFGAVGIPYSIKFLWSPLVDNLRIPLLTRLFGKRRSWLYVVQALLAVAIIGLGTTNPLDHLSLMAFFAVAVATLSATQDIVIDAYRVELLQPEDQAKGAAAALFGYRLGMLVSGAGAFYLADVMSWSLTYAIMASMLGVGFIAALLLGEPEQSAKIDEENRQRATKESAAQWVTRAVIMPFRDFTRRKAWLAILLFILLYKFGDAFLGIMTMPLLQELGYTKTEVANIGKIFGFGATIAGAFFGAWMADRYGLMRSLWIGGILNGASNLAFWWLTGVGHDLTVYAIVNSLENFTGAMSGAILVAYLSVLCNIRYTATQYALLSSLSSVGRTLLSTSAGFTVEATGWDVFFLISAALVLPSLWLLYYLQRHAPPPEQAARAHQPSEVASGA